jgi:hypothetical protein
MKKWHIIFLMGLSICKSNGQSFNGLIVHKIINHDSARLENMAKYTHLAGKLNYQNIDSIWIKNDSVKSIIRGLYSNQLNSLLYQDKNRAFMAGSDSVKINYNAKIFERGDEAKFIKKEKGNFEISGYKCSLYIYAGTADILGNYQIKYWIADDFRDRVPYKYGKNFPRFFAPEGLFLKYEIYYEGKLNMSREVIYIQVCDIPKEEFEMNFLKEEPSLEKPKLKGISKWKNAKN